MLGSSHHLERVTSSTALDSLQDEPGGRRLQDSALQGDRRATATVAAGDELPMNFHETHVL